MHRVLAMLATVWFAVADAASACGPNLGRPIDWTKLSPAELCASIQTITETPVKDAPLLGESLYDELRRRSGDVGGCLADRISDITWMDEPFCPSVVQQIPVGDFAFLLLSRLGYFAWREVLPSEWEAAHVAGGISAYYLWAARPGNRALLQRTARDWIEAHPFAPSEPPMAIEQAKRERDARVAARDYAGAIRLTGDLASSGAGHSSIPMALLQLQWLEDASIETRPDFDVRRPLALLAGESKVAALTNEPGARGRLVEATTQLEQIYRSGRAGVARNESLANCWQRVRERGEKPGACDAPERASGFAPPEAGS